MERGRGRVGGVRGAAVFGLMAREARDGGGRRALDEGVGNVILLAEAVEGGSVLVVERTVELGQVGGNLEARARGSAGGGGGRRGDGFGVQVKTHRIHFRGQ